MKNKLIILYGGPSSEREVSFGTRDFFEDLYKDLNPISVEWSENGKFIYKNKKLSEENFLNTLVENNHTVIISSHGEYVEDGYIQSKFENKGIPFTGSDFKSCALSMDKEKSQKTVNQIVKTIPTYKSYKKLNFPYVAKPNSLGSSIGVFLVKDNEDLKSIENEINNNYIFQPYVEGRELSLGTVRSNDGYLKLYPTEIISKTTFFDYEAKYESGKAEEITPADIDKNITNKLIDITNKIHEELGLGYYSRSDFILSNENEIYYLETNSLPGMTKTSLVPQQLQYSSLLDEFKNGLIENLIVKS